MARGKFPKGLGTLYFLLLRSLLLILLYLSHSLLKKIKELILEEENKMENVSPPRPSHNTVGK